VTESAALPPIVAAGSEYTNLAELISAHADSRPDDVAVVEPGPERRTTTWSELNGQIDAVAAGFAAHGLVAGHRIGILGPNSIEFVVAYFAALRAGFVAVPINPLLGRTEVQQIVADSGLRVLLTPTDRELKGVHHVSLTPDGLASLAAPDATPASSPKDREALAVLLYTAGTSGEPKAAMLTHRALLSHLAQVAQFGVISSETVVLAMLPLFHVFGLNAVLGGWALAGARLVIMDGMDGFFEVVAAEQVTNVPLAPAVLSKIITDERCADLARTVTTVISGAAPLSEELRADFVARTGLPVEQGYGLTEAAPGVSVTFGAVDHGSEHGYVGRPLPGVEVRIGDGTEETEPGEIWIRGENLFSGYWPDGHGGPAEDGWFATGDIGYLDDGGLFLVDRARELIIVNGFNVYPAEVEGAIGELAGVDSVAVVGRADPRTGEQVVAFVTGEVTAEMIMDHCESRLAKFKRPAVVRVVEELPRGATGKVQKGHLRHVLGELGV
jgi:long-chain acyl-CoA synthetase